MITFELLGRSISRGKWWMFIGVLVTIVFTVVVMLKFPVVYKSSWTMLLPVSGRVSTINLEQIGEAVSNSNSAYSNISVSPKTTYREIALSTAVINRAAELLNITPAEFGAPKIKLVDQTSAIIFSVKAQSAEHAQKKGQIFNQVFHETLDRLREDELNRQQNGMTAQLEQAKKALKQARQSILNFQSDSAIISNRQFEEMALNTERIRLKHADIESELNRIEGFNDALLSSIAISPLQASQIIMLQADQAIGAILIKRAELNAEIMAKRTKLAKKHPKMQVLVSEFSSVHQHLLSEIAKRAPALNSLDMNLVISLLKDEVRQSVEDLIHTVASQDGLEQQAQTLKNKLKEFEARLSDHSEDAARLADLKRDHQIAEAIFSSALAKIDTNKLDVYATYPLTQLLTHPSLPHRAVRIYKFLLLVAAALSILFYLTAVLLVCLRLEYRLSN